MKSRDILVCNYDHPTFRRHPQCTTVISMLQVQAATGPSSYFTTRGTRETRQKLNSDEWKEKALSYRCKTYRPRLHFAVPR